MQIVIDIPGVFYEGLKEADEMINGPSGQRNGKTLMSVIYNAVAKGIPLPEGHGRLIILSEDKLKENQTDFSFYFQKWISEVGLSNATVAIIEADKAEGSGKDADSN